MVAILVGVVTLACAKKKFPRCVIAAVVVGEMNQAGVKKTIPRCVVMNAEILAGV